MTDLKEKLLDTMMLNDCEYLDKYCEFILLNKCTPKIQHKTQSHHIIPRCYFKIIATVVDNSDENKVNLYFKDHILAHCYLVLASKENIFKHYNMCALYKLIGHQDISDIKDIIHETEEFQTAYESSRKISSMYNPMNDTDIKNKHDEIMRSEKTRLAISNSMKEYRKNHPFTDEHRKKISESMKGNHNFGNSDTRSIECYCVLSDGSIHYFHNYKIAGKWWFDNFHPFGDSYSEATFQRKIKSSIYKDTITYARGKNKIEVTNIKWFKGGGNNEVNNS